MCTGFCRSVRLCNAILNVARELACEMVDPLGLEAFPFFSFLFYWVNSTVTIITCYFKKRYFFVLFLGMVTAMNI
jgi:hypothetical protein